MSRFLFVSVFFCLPVSLWAGYAPTALSVCKVGNFDKSNVDLHCDPRHNFVMKTPRSWLKGKTIARDKNITLEINRSFMEKWYKLNAKRHQAFLKKLAATKSQEKGRSK
jgi:hypothetical protein